MRAVRLLVVVPAAAVLLVAGCGGSTSGSGGPVSAPPGNGVADLPAAEILTKAKAAVTEAESVRVKGAGSSSGAKYEIDMRYGSEAKAIGTISNNGQVVELRRMGGLVYLKAGKEFWTSVGGASAAALLAGKYVKAPIADKRVSQLAGFTDKAKFVDEVIDAKKSISKGERKTIRGTEAIGLVDKSADGGTLYIATTGKPYPLQLVPAAGGAESGSVDFLEYDKAVTVPTPPAEQTLDLTKLGGG